MAAPSKYLEQSKGEEIANSITHGIGAVLAIAALIILIISSAKTGNHLKEFAFIVFGVSLFVLYTSSTFSHALRNEKAKKIFQVLDYTAIYLLIAGSYTPILTGPLRTESSDYILAGIWILALGGILFKVFFFGKYEAVSMFIYLQMGWIAIFLVDRLVRIMPAEFIILIFAGGLSYTIGTGFYLATKMRFHHFIWHLFVLGGSITHFFAILLFT